MSLWVRLTSNYAVPLSSLALLVGACSSEPAGPATLDTTTETSVSALDAPASGDILDALKKVPGIVEVTEGNASQFPGTRFFVVRFEQPVDHLEPQGAKFTQRFTLLFRAYDAPMVLATTGYGITPRAYMTEPTFLLQANQILLEHRYFVESTPAAPLDWSKLDIFQMATDEHRITQALKPLFGKKWLNTGGSKGGMTAVYHRFFYPNDVHVTLPYVAPNSIGKSDPRYVTFVEKVGDAACRTKLKEFQIEVLKRRAEIEPMLADEATASGTAYERVGIHRGLDFLVTEAPFTFWQYRPQRFCDRVPAKDATTAQLFSFLSFVYFGSPSAGGFGDSSLDSFAPYFYQSATELGGPGYAYSHMRQLLTPGFRDVPEAYPPLGVNKPFRFYSMPIVATWVDAAAPRMLFIYGENDPWSSGAFTVRAKNDSYRYFVPGGTHGSQIANLPEPQRSEALAHLAAWMDVSIPAPFAAGAFAALGEGEGELPYETMAMWSREHRGVE